MTSRLKLFFFLAFILGNAASAQVMDDDSLKNLLESVKDTARVNLLNKIAFRLIYTLPQKSEKFSKEAIELAQQLQYSYGTAKGYNVLGISHDIRGNYNDAINAFTLAWECSTNNQVEDVELKAMILNGQGLVYLHKSLYNDALASFLRVLEILDPAKHELLIANVYNNIGLIYDEQQEYDKALQHYEKSLVLAEKISNEKLIGTTTNNIGVIYKHLEFFDEAIKFFNRSLEHKRKINDAKGISSSMQNLSSIYKNLNDYGKALDYINNSLKIKQTTDDKEGIIICNTTKVEILIGLKKYNEARVIADENMSLAAQLGNPQLRIFTYETYYVLYKSLQNYEHALHWHVKMTALKDSLFNTKKSKQLAELYALYDLNKKEIEIVKLEKQREEDAYAKKMMVVLLLSLGSAGTFLGYLLWYRLRKKQEMLKVELELQMRKAENAILREEELNKEIEFKNKELASYTINFVQKSELMEELKRSLHLLSAEDVQFTKKVSDINKIIEYNYNVDREWEDFKMQFENVHTNFFKVLKDRFPDLTSGDLRLCALLKLNMNMNMKEAAKVLGISPESVKTARYRLRKKLGLQQVDSLVDFILNIEGVKQTEDRIEVIS